MSATDQPPRKQTISEIVREEMRKGRAADPDYDRKLWESLGFPEKPGDRLLRERFEYFKKTGNTLPPGQSPPGSNI